MGNRAKHGALTMAQDDHESPFPWDLWDGERSALEAATTRQAEAVAAGRRALNEGRAVIWLHGRPYEDPAADPQPETDRHP